MLEWTMRIRLDVPMMRVSITYPCDFQQYPGWGYPTHSDIYKGQHLTKLRHMLHEAYPRMSGIWRVEAQGRGTPHFHLALFGIEDSARGLKTVLDVFWAKILEVSSLHERCIVVDENTMPSRITQWLGYLSKVKPDQDLPDHIVHKGYLWGKWFKEMLPLEDDLTIAITDEKNHHFVRRILQRHVRATSRNGRWYQKKERATVRARFGGSPIAVRALEYLGLIDRTTAQEGFAGLVRAEREIYARLASNEQPQPAQHRSPRRHVSSCRSDRAGLTSNGGRLTTDRRDEIARR